MPPISVATTALPLHLKMLPQPPLPRAQRLVLVPPVALAPAASRRMAALRKWLLSGLLVVVPMGVTIWVLNSIIGVLDSSLLILPEGWHPTKLLGIHIPGLGAVLTLLILLVVGFVSSNFVGRKLVLFSDNVVGRIPIVRSIYSGIKQVSDTLFAENGNAFRTAVLIQWPREGVWTIAFITGAPGGDAATYLPGDYVSVYVPTTPNPTGGYFVMLRKSDCIELNMSVDNALKYIVSMGVVVPTMPAAKLPDIH